MGEGAFLGCSVWQAIGGGRPTMSRGFQYSTDVGCGKPQAEPDTLRLT